MKAFRGHDYNPQRIAEGILRAEARERITNIDEMEADYLRLMAERMAQYKGDKR